jgi:hypothetical protein
MYIFYADIETYCETHPYTVQVTVAEEPRNPRPTAIKTPIIVIDMTSYTPTRPPHTSINILPYVILALSFPYIRFDFQTQHLGQHGLLCSFARNVLFRNSSKWESLVLNSIYVSEIRIHWKQKGVEIIMRPDSE